MKQRWLFSNFEPLEVPIRGIDPDDRNEYRTVEAAYQAAKTADPRERAPIAATTNPVVAKRLGRKVTLRPCWDNVVGREPFSVWVMRELLLRKFEQEVFRERLLAFQAPIVEWNTWHDRFWGCCVCPKHQGEGQNWLGRLLTEIRSNLLLARGQS